MRSLNEIVRDNSRAEAREVQLKIADRSLTMLLDGVREHIGKDTPLCPTCCKLYVDVRRDRGDL